VKIVSACNATSPIIQSNCTKTTKVYTFKDKKCTVVEKCDGDSTANAFQTGFDCAKKCLIGRKGQLKKSGNGTQLEDILKKPLTKRS
jgi:hypothetical protein